MNTRNVIAGGLIMLTSLSALASTPVDVNQSTVLWFGKKVTGAHDGSLQLKEATVDIEDTLLKGGRFVFDMTSIKVLDIKDERWNKKLENHLKNEDFFAVDEFPEAVFEISQVKPLETLEADARNYDVKGDLTIKGITHVVRFQAQVDIRKKQSRARGEIIVDRTLYGIKYKSGKFFEDIGDRAIYDDFSISFDLVTQ